MASTAMFAEIAALSGDPARASMLHVLMDGRAFTAMELARVAGVTPQTASGHLSRMTAAGLITVERQGRHRYHRLATPSVARMLESMMQVAAELEPGRARLTVGPRDAALRNARICYDHFAGHLGVALSDALIANGHVEFGNEAASVTDAGMTFLDKLGIDIAPMLGPGAAPTRRVLCRPCLDWSERRPHLAGRLGAAICTHSMKKGWTRRAEHSRAVLVTPKGERAFREWFGLKVEK